MGLVMADEPRDPVLMRPSDLVTSSKLARSVGSYLDAAQKGPLFITRGQEVDAVLLSLDEYRSLLMEQNQLDEMLDVLLSMKRLLNHLLAGQPKLLSTEEVMAQLGISQADVDAVAADELDR